MNRTDRLPLAAGSSWRQLILIVFSKVLKERYLDAIYFMPEQIGGVKLEVVDMSDFHFKDTGLRDGLLGAIEATELGYAKTVDLVFKFFNESPDCILERFGLHFDHTQHSASMSSPSGQLDIALPTNRTWSDQELVTILRELDEACGALDPLPRANKTTGGVQAMFRIDYNLSAPKGYQAPGFKRSTFPNLRFSSFTGKTPKFPSLTRSLSEKSELRSTLSVKSLFVRPEADSNERRLNEQPLVALNPAPLAMPALQKRRSDSAATRRSSPAAAALRMDAGDAQAPRNDAAASVRAPANVPRARNLGLLLNVTHTDTSASTPYRRKEAVAPAPVKDAAGDTDGDTDDEGSDRDGLARQRDDEERRRKRRKKGRISNAHSVRVLFKSPSDVGSHSRSTLGDEEEESNEIETTRRDDLTVNDDVLDDHRDHHHEMILDGMERRPVDSPRVRVPLPTAAVPAPPMKRRSVPDAVMVPPKRPSSSTLRPSDCSLLSSLNESDISTSRRAVSNGSLLRLSDGSLLTPLNESDISTSRRAVSNGSLLRSSDGSLLTPMNESDISTSREAVAFDRTSMESRLTDESAPTRRGLVNDSTRNDSSLSALSTSLASRQSGEDDPVAHLRPLNDSDISTSRGAEVNSTFERSIFESDDYDGIESDGGEPLPID